MPIKEGQQISSNMLKGSFPPETLLCPKFEDLKFFSDGRHPVHTGKTIVRTFCDQLRGNQCQLTGEACDLYGRPVKVRSGRETGKGIILVMHPLSRFRENNFGRVR